MLLINRKESIKLNRHKKKRERGSLCVCVYVCMVACVRARMCVRMRVYEYVGVIPYTDATFQVS